MTVDVYTQTCNLQVTARKHRALSSVFISSPSSASPDSLGPAPRRVSSLGHRGAGHTLATATSFLCL